MPILKIWPLILPACHAVNRFVIFAQKKALDRAFFCARENVYPGESLSTEELVGSALARFNACFSSFSA